MKDTLYDVADRESKGLVARTRGFVATYFPYIMLIGNIVFEVVVRLFEVGFTVPFTPAFWSSLFINTLSSTLSYACFVFYAEERKKRNSGDYITNCDIWASKSADVRLNHFEEFLEHCKEQYEREVEERQIAIIVNNSRVNVKLWREKYKTLSNREINALVRTREISRQDAKWIKKANRRPHIEPIDPLLILSGMKVGDLNDAGRSHVSTVKSVIFRPIPVIAVSICASMFAGTFIGVSNTSVLFDMLYTAAMIILASLFGYTKGVANAERKHNEIKSRIIFLERFELNEKHQSM
jgi:hypothetical protein